MYVGSYIFVRVRLRGGGGRGGGGGGDLWEVIDLYEYV